MLRNIKDLETRQISATGEVADCYFDDAAWVVRYLVVDTGSWLAPRKILLSPYAVGALDWNGEDICVSVTKAQIKNSPSIDTAKPVSRQHEQDYSGYYEYPYYWGGSGLWGMGEFPQIVTDNEFKTYARARSEQEKSTAANDPHLRSCNAVVGYHIQAVDGDIGHVQGYLVDTRSWAIRYLIVNTSNWWLGNLVLVSPEWIDQVSWNDRSVTIDWTRQAVKDAAVYDPALPFDRGAEVNLYDHYGYTSHYWGGVNKRKVA